jgi:putative transposase
MTKKRNTFTDAFKAKVALEAYKGLKTVNELSTQYKVHPSQIAKWKKQVVSGAPSLFARSKSGTPGSEDELTAPLYEEIGRLKMDIKWLEKKL